MCEESRHDGRQCDRRRSSKPLAESDERTCSSVGLVRSIKPTVLPSRKAGLPERTDDRAWTSLARVWCGSRPADLRPRWSIPGIATVAMIGPRVTVVVVVLAFLFSLHSLKYCLICTSTPIRKNSVEKYKEDEEPCESLATSDSAGFLSLSTLHTVNIEGVIGHVNCGAACSLGLRPNCSEPGRSECPTILRTPAKSAVAFRDLPEGDYVVTVDCKHCQEPEISCYAEPQEFGFSVQLLTPETKVSLTEIPLRNINLYKNFTGQCTNERVWRSRISCLGIMYILVGAVLLLISLRVRSDDEEVTSSFFVQDMKWVLQTRCRSS